MSLRFRSITIGSFRGVNRRINLDLDHNIIILKGTNGTGKTSIIDAIEWGITDKIGRLLGSRDLVVYKDVYGNFFSEINPKIELEFERKGHSFYLQRIGRKNGHTQELKLYRDNRIVNNSKIHENMSFLFPNNVWGHFVILEQDNLSDFITERNPRSRYDILINFFGLKQVNLLRKKIQKVKNYLKKEKITGIETELKISEKIIDSIETFDIDRFISRLQRELGQKLPFKTNTVKEGIKFDKQLGRFELSKEISEYLEISKIISSEEIKEKEEELSLSIENKKSRLRDKREDLKEINQISAEIVEELDYDKESIEISSQFGELSLQRSELVNEQNTIEKMIEELKREIEEVENAISLTITEKDDFQKFLTLGSKFIEHANECPLCNSKLDYDLMKRLENKISKHENIKEKLTNKKNQLESQSTEKRRQSVFLSDRIRIIDAQIVDYQRDQDNITSRVTRLKSRVSRFLDQHEIEYPLENILDKIKVRKKSLEKEASDLEKLIDKEMIKRKFLNLLEYSSVRVEKHKALSDREYARLTQEYLKNLELYDFLDQATEELQLNEKKALEQRISIINENFQLIYNKLTPHPYFNRIKIKPEYGRMEGEIFFESESVNVKNIFSTAQNNILALAIYFAINRQLNEIEKIPIILDDPVQSMDYQSMVKVIELLISLSEKQQIIITTSSDTFSKSLKEYFRFWTEKSSLIEYTLYDWSNEGSIIEEQQYKSLGPITSIKNYLENV